ncbi:hypothetical protein BC628DRAFT_933126 [Trametes gibbosa]|nr:hypothetical protein BC628DRAFT_933126 [Trametes gibbosa]
MILPDAINHPTAQEPLAITSTFTRAVLTFSRGLKRTPVSAHVVRLIPRASDPPVRSLCPPASVREATAGAASRRLSAPGLHRGGLRSVEKRPAPRCDHQCAGGRSIRRDEFVGSEGAKGYIEGLERTWRNIIVGCLSSFLPPPPPSPHPHTRSLIYVLFSDALFGPRYVSDTVTTMHLLSFVVLAVAASGLAAPVESVTDSIGSTTTVSIRSVAPMPIWSRTFSSGPITSIVSSSAPGRIVRVASTGIPSSVSAPATATTPLAVPSGSPAPVTSVVRASGPITTLPAAPSQGPDPVGLPSPVDARPRALVDGEIAPLGARQNAVPPEPVARGPCTMSSLPSPSASSVPLPPQAKRMLPANFGAGVGVHAHAHARRIASVTLPAAPTAVTGAASTSFLSVPASAAGLTRSAVRRKASRSVSGAPRLPAGLPTDVKVERVPGASA